MCKGRVSATRAQSITSYGLPGPVVRLDGTVFCHPAVLSPSLIVCWLLSFLALAGEEAGAPHLLQATLLGFNAHSLQDSVHLLHVVQVSADLQRTTTAC